MILPFHFIQFTHLNASYVTVNVNHNRYGHCRFGCRDGNGEQGEEIAFQSVREQETVEYSEVDVRSVEYQLDADQYGQCVATGKESVNAGEKHDSGATGY